MVRQLFPLGATAIVLLLTQNAAAGRQKPTHNSSSVNPKDPVAIALKGGDGDPTGEQIVKTTIATSRPEVTTSGTFGVYADLQNLASVPITLYPRETTLVVQPEVGRDPDCVLEFDGFFPTEPNVLSNPPLGGPIVIPPKEHYQVFWGLGTAGNTRCSRTPAVEGFWSWPEQRWKNFKANIGFLPGDYAFAVVGKAYLSPGGKVDPAYHTFVQGTKLHVGITQLQSMIAAMIGGLLAYFVAGLREGGELRTLKREQTDNKRSSVSKYLVILRGVISAALLSSVVTIILSRLSDTQFPIKVSVADFWGALTVGFVAFFTGNKLIDRIVGLGGGPKPTPPVIEPTAPTGPMAGNSGVASPPLIPPTVPGGHTAVRYDLSGVNPNVGSNQG
jgi:hypothetical protein